MRKTSCFVALAAGLALAAAGSAQMAATSTKTTTTTTKPTLGKSKAVVNSQSNLSATTVAANGHMVSTTTSTGKKITYDCSKAGNKTKAACKGHA